MEQVRSVFPLPFSRILAGRAVLQVREAAGMFRREGERIEIAFETHKRSGRRRVVIFFCIMSFEAVNRRHRIDGCAESDIPDHQFVRRCRRASAGEPRDMTARRRVGWLRHSARSPNA